MDERFETYGKFCEHGTHVDDDCDDCTVWHGEMVNCRADLADLEFADVTISQAQHNGLIARVRHAAGAAVLALALSTSVAGAQDVPPETYTRGCVQVGVTGEGFPVMYCAEDGALYYIDLDGIDGALGTQGDGRWLPMAQ